jgi:hypothetical protein
MNSNMVLNHYFNMQGVNTYMSPLLQDGALIHSVNVDSFPLGAKTKRAGYVSFLSSLGTPVQSLWSFPRQDGTSLTLYAKAGSLIYHSVQGTAPWTVCGNGTVSTSSHIGYAILDNTMIIGDGVGSTRHTTNGTAFTSTTLAPPGEFFAQYQNRIYIGGTSSTLFYSVTNDATNWHTSGTSDSNSLTIPGAGKLARIFKSTNQLVATKNSGAMFRWDGFSLTDMATNYGPSSAYSVDQTEDYWFFMNRYGMYGFNGDKPQLLSNPVQRQIYNSDNTGITGTSFGTIPAVVHGYDYLAAIGTVTDDFTQQYLPGAVLKYDIQKNQYMNYQYNNNPTCFCSYLDSSQNRQLIFGDQTGQVYQISGTTNTDNGTPISTEMIFLYTFDSPEYDKQWRWFRAFFNPGAQAQVQIAAVNEYEDINSFRWQELGDNVRGVNEYKFPQGSRSKFLAVRVYDRGNAARYVYHGCAITAQIITQT